MSARPCDAFTCRAAWLKGSPRPLLARFTNAQGVVCGHIHHAEMRQIEGVLYCNDGNWVESLTALVEHADGRLEIIDWVAREAARKAAAPSLLQPAAL